MALKIAINILVYVCFSLSALCQQDTLLQISTAVPVAQDVTDFTTDNLGNLYLVSSDNQIKKLNERGDSIGVYNDVKKYGRVFSLDATNPLKLLIYYKEFSTIVVLDRFLNKRNIIDLRKINMMQVKTITSSYDNNYWVYDEMDNRLRKIDDNSNILLETADLRQAFNTPPQPVAMYDRDGQLYLYDTAQGMYVFDYYGARKNLLAIPHLNHVQVIDKQTITALDSTSLIIYKPASLQLKSYKIMNEMREFTKCNLSNRKLYCLTAEGKLEAYTLSE